MGVLLTGWSGAAGRVGAVLAFLMAATPPVLAGSTEPDITGSLGRQPLGAVPPDVPQPADAQDFRAFVQGLWPLAKAKGVTRATFDQAFAGVEPDPKIEDLTRRQSEFVKPVWAYLNDAVTPQRIERGRDALRRWGPVLASLEAKSGIDRGVLLGVWGMETNFGSFTGGRDVIRSLATLAHMRYRGTFFRDELVTALVILQQGHVARADMKGSWAGAMGQTQFMPSSFMRYAVDGDSDGRKDIWNSVPDALASTANYLKKHGWHAGQPWGFEVSLPANFHYGLLSAGYRKWSAVGVRKSNGTPFPPTGNATLFLPAGAGGPAFLVTANFDVIKTYNASDAYALGVAHLGDRIGGGAALAADWPLDQPPLGKAERLELQRRLARLGYDIGEPDGRLGSRTREALRHFQATAGLPPDGYASSRVLEALRAQR
jgi:lytic murein transglycosylase